MSIIVVKLGGAAITDKSIPDTLSPNLNNVLDGIASAYNQSLRPSGRRLILIHGAGSFGHPPAKKYQVKAGWTTALDHQPPSARDRAKFGTAVTRQRVLQLHVDILRRLQERGGMPVLSVSAYDTVSTEDGEVTESSGELLVTRVQRVLDEGFVPLLSGDVVFDSRLGATVLSGDALMHLLAQRLPDNAVRCIFITDVRGVFTRDPKRFPDAVLIPRIHCASEDGGGGGGVIDYGENRGDDDDGTERTDVLEAVDDVTGAMLNKWQWARRIVVDGAGQVPEVVICQASDAERAIGLVDNGDDAEMSSGWTTIVL